MAAPRLDPAFLKIPIAHRGLHDASKGVIENALSAFEAAISHGYGIELDVQLSADGEAMSFHDDTLDRLTVERGNVSAQNASALKTISLSGSADTIPDMRQTLDLIAGRVPLLIEIKDQDGALGPNVGPLEKRLAELLSGYKGPLGVMSFNPHSIAAFASFAPDIPRGRVTCTFDDWPGVSGADLAALQPISPKNAGGISFVSHDRADLTSPHVTAAKASTFEQYLATMPAAT